MLIRARTIAPTLVALGAVLACSTPPSGGSSSSGSAPPPAAPAQALAPLARNLHPFARPEFDVGHRDPSILTAGSIYFKLSDAQRAERDALVAAVQNPASPSYHKWLSVEDYASRFGARAADVERVSAWLRTQGLTIDGASRTGSRIGFRGTGGQVEAAFHTEIHNFEINGQPHYAMASAPLIPSELAPGGARPPRLPRLPAASPRLTRIKHGPDGSTQDPIYGETALGPSDFEVLYNTAPLTAAGTTGTGVNLVIIGQTYFNPADVASFRSQFNLTSVKEVDVLVPNTGTQAVNSGGDLGETELDLEWSSATAPGANIIFVYTGSDKANFGVDDSVAYTVEQGAHLVPGTGNGAAQIISESYGSCDAEYAGSDADIDGEIAAAANLQGMTYLAASGDSGAAGCLPEAGGLFTGPPADMPGVTAVGGTEFCGKDGCFYSGAPANHVQVPPFFTGNNASEYPLGTGGVSLEGVWNDSVAGDNYNSAGGGGASTIWTKPAYQVGVAGMPNDGARDVPDVALTASPNNVGYLVWEPTELADGGPTDGLGPIGGTSASTPSFAGILARVNQAVTAGGRAPLGLGNVNPQLYALFANNATLGAFHDIVSGDNISPCNPANQREYPGCPIPDGGLPEGGLLPDGGAVPSTYGGYSAHVGYDLASGLGSVDAAKLVAAWVGFTPTGTALTAPATATVGAPVTLTATVSAAAGSTNTNAIGGSVTFAFMTLQGDAGAPYSVDAGGGADESWVLGTAKVTAGTGSPAKATATLSAAIPPGIYGQAYVVAEYSGDTQYLASNSAPAGSFVSVTGSTLKVLPGAITLAPNGQTTFTTTGGAPPLTWGIEGTDTTCVVIKHHGEVCSSIESLTPTTAAFQAGGQGRVGHGHFATDTLGEEAIVTVTVSGAAVDAGSGLPPVDDAGPPGGPGNPPLSSDDGGRRRTAATPER